VRQIFYSEKIPVKPGVVSILEALKAENIPIAIASSTRRGAVVSELTEADLIKYFDRLVCGDMVTHSKPHPEIFLTACRELGVRPENAYAIEDSYNGIRSAHAGGLRPIMVPDCLPPTKEMEMLSEAVFDNLYEVEKYLIKK